MKLEQRIVTKIPLEELWTETENLPHQRREYLTERQVQDLLLQGNVAIVIASCGLKPSWIMPQSAFSKFKNEIKGHIVNDFDRIVLEEYEDEWCYLASLWTDTQDRKVLLLETLH
jgi:DNA-binding helix-hairpin-helix protein with protein kinase domain